MCLFSKEKKQNFIDAILIMLHRSGNYSIFLMKYSSIYDKGFFLYCYFKEGSWQVTISLQKTTF